MIQQFGGMDIKYKQTYSSIDRTAQINLILCETAGDSVLKCLSQRA